MTGAIDLADIRLQRNVCRLDGRRTFELLRELGARFLIRSEIDAAVARYGEIDAASLSEVGGDRPVAAPLYLVPPDERHGHLFTKVNKTGQTHQAGDGGSPRGDLQRTRGR